MADFENSSSDENTSLSSDGEDENQLPSVQSKLQDTKKKSKQLRYYHRKTKGRAKRKYTPFSEQENPSRQLKSYHAAREESVEDSADAACLETSSENDDHTEEEMDVDESQFESASNTTSSMDDSDELSSVSQDGSSRSESEDYNEPEETGLPLESETAQPSEEPLYQGSKISKILSFVLIVSFVLKHNLTKAAWADLLRLLTALLGERCKEAFQSVYKMKLFMKGYFGSKEPTKISYCAKCFIQVTDRCQNVGC